MKPQTIFVTLALIALCSMAAFAQGGKTSSSLQLVRDVDQPAKQFFNKLTSTNFSDIVTVPAGKVLVIESVTGLVTTTGNIGPLVLSGFSDLTGTEMLQYIAPTFYNSADKTTYYTHLGRYYVPAGQTVRVFWGGAGSPTEFDANITGYFVDVP